MQMWIKFPEKKKCPEIKQDTSTAFKKERSDAYSN
jgi:hypothetical protein